jgi:hypothetical protein
MLHETALVQVFFAPCKDAGLKAKTRRGWVQQGHLRATLSRPQHFHLASAHPLRRPMAAGDYVRMCGWVRCFL